MMKIELSPQQIEAQASFRNFVNQEIIPKASRYEQEERLPAELITKLAQLGYCGATLPKAWGGQEMDMITYGLLNEELGRGSSSVRGLVMLQNMIGQTLLRWGSKSQKEFWLPKIASGEVITALALTEPDVGSDLKNIETMITSVNGSFILNGHKHWISFGQIANLFLILGQYEGKLCVFLLEKDTPGFSIEPISEMSGVRATMLARLHLKDCQVPQGNMVGGIGFGMAPVALHALDLGRYSIAWGCVGIAQACLEACLQHTSTRKQFGVYLKEHQLIQEMITNMIVNIKAARLLCCQAGYLRGVGDPSSFIETFIAKYFASTMATRVANDAVQIHGALGCQNSHPVQRHLRDAKTMEIIEGTTQIHQLKIAEDSYRLYKKGA